MVDQAQEGTYVILYVGMLGMFFLAFAIVGFVIIYKKRLLKQQMKLQQQRIIHQQQLLQRTVKIQDDERKRFAADLHDEIGGGISTILLSVERIKTTQANQPEIETTSQHIRNQLNDLLKKVREISYNIMPPTLEDFGLHEAISDLCYSITESSDLQIQYVWNGDEQRLDFSQELAIYRIIQELLINTIKHAKATQVEITIENTAENFKALYTDNGKGFDTETIRKGAGVHNIHNRAQIMGAELTVASILHKGTTITFNLNKKIA
ncbi:MAG: ATP-binding protein [Bacteroidota bacterium]